MAEKKPKQPKKAKGALRPKPAAAAPKQLRKLLVLHGWGQSGAEMAKVLGSADPAKLKKSSLAKKLKDELNCELVCASAPHVLPATATVLVDGVAVTLDEAVAGKEERAWFFYSESDKRDYVLEGSQDAPGFLADVDRAYLGWRESVAALAAVCEAEGPFDGVLGFSQGAVMAHTLCWLSQQTPPDYAADAAPWKSLKFAILCAGFPSRMKEQRDDVRDTMLAMAMPSLHISGEHDRNVPPQFHRELAACFDGAELYEHDIARGHVMPQRGKDRDAVAGFVRRALASKDLE